MQASVLRITQSATKHLLRPAFRATVPYRTATTMTSGVFKYIDPASNIDIANHPSGLNKPWTKVDDGGYSFKLTDHPYKVHDMRAAGLETFSTDSSGFAVYTSPAKEKAFTDDAQIRSGYYGEVEALVREKLSGVKKVVIFDHTIRKREKASPRQPVQQVHVDQTPGAAEVRVRRHIEDPAEADELLKGRYQIINVWRPIGHAATDFPLAVIDWRSTKPEDFIKVDLLYPKRQPQTNGAHDDDDRGKEALPDPTSVGSTANYEAKGETYAVAPSKDHQFYYAKDMTPDEAMFIKCFDSWSENREGSTVKVGAGKKGLADCTPHTAFVDPGTPAEAPGRQSIEVRCLVFYE